jgi:predicted nucleic-acid-binding Zn-ribbon protein
MASSSPDVPLRPCPECGGARVHAYIASVPGSLSVANVESGGIFPKFSELRAVVCTNCGYTTFYAKQPEKLVPKART